MSNQYSEEKFKDIDPLFHTMTVKAIAELEGVDMCTDTLNRRRRRLGIPIYRPPKKMPPLTNGQVDGLMRNWRV